jgi:predicted HTH domain antitoxin
MSVIVPDEVLWATRMSEQEMRAEIAVMLFEREKMTLEQAARLAEMPLVNFQHLLASRDIPLHYDLQDFEEDLATLARSGVR